MRSLLVKAVDVSIAVALFSLAVAIRLPNYDNIPAYTDEVTEVALSIDMAEGGALPLVHTEGYRGPIWPYLLAGWLKAYGLRPAAPRLFALVLGALTVVATFFLARILSGRSAGIIAGLFMATAFSHVTLGSHVAWSNNSTPLWVTAALAATVIGSGAARAAGPVVRPAIWFGAAGVAWGLAIQSHPSALAPLLGTGLWFIIERSRRTMLAGRGIWMGAVLGLVSVSPMILYNAGNDWSGMREATAPRQPIASDHGPLAVSARAVALAGQLGRMSGAGHDEELAPDNLGALAGATAAARPAATMAYALMLALALVLAFRPGTRVLPIVAAVSCAVLLMVNDSYDNFYDTRYLAILLPVGYAALGSVGARYWATNERGRAVTAAALAVMALYPLLTTSAYYDREIAIGRTNAPMRVAADRLALRDQEAEHTFVDKAMRPLKLGGGGDPTRAFDLMLTLRRVEHGLSDVDEIRWFLLNDGTTTFWIIAADETADSLTGQFELDTWETGEGWVVLERPGSELP